MIQKPRIIDVIHLLGSIASITGISLLWLKPELNVITLFFDIPIIAFLVLLSLGIVSYGIIAIRFGYSKLLINKDLLWKTAYFSTAISIIFAGISLVLFNLWYLAIQVINSL